jgi:hypothetical protein
MYWIEVFVSLTSEDLEAIILITNAVSRVFGGMNVHSGGLLNGQDLLVLIKDTELFQARVTISGVCFMIK